MVCRKQPERRSLEGGCGDAEIGAVVGGDEEGDSPREDGLAIICDLSS